MPRWLYSILLWAALPFVLLRLLRRARRQRAYLRHLPERFGRYAQRAAVPAIWLHAVSVGETRAAAPIVKALRARYPRHQILLTHTTPTGRQTSEELFGDDVIRVYLPFDLAFAVRRFLAHFKPVLGVILETELWPNLIHYARQRNMPLALVNARMSARSAARYAKFARISRETLGALQYIAAQTAADASRLSALGARAVEIAGNVKFDIAPPLEVNEISALIDHRTTNTHKILLCVSTRDKEEELILNAVWDLLGADALIVLVPRHPQRFDEVAALLANRGINFQRRSTNEPIRATTRVLLGDSMGEMFAYYAACDVAFVGGSLLPLGGQNLLEACAMGKPAIVGPHTFNFEEATQLAIEAGAALRVADAGELAREAARLLADPALREKMGAAGREFVRAHQGATARIMQSIKRLLPAAELAAHRTIAGTSGTSLPS
jgi:3-deoxy-D-manno-octulosonic-acid transferase